MDQDLRDLVEQMRQLIPVLQSMRGTGATSGGSANDMSRGVDKMVVAMAKLAATLDTSKKTKLSEEEAIKKFTKAVDKTTESIDKEEKERQAAIKKLEEEVKARDEAIRRSKLSQQEREREDQALAAKKAKEAAANSNKEAKENADKFRRSSSSSKDLYDSLSSAGSGADVLKGQFLNLGGDSLKATAGLQLLSAGFDGVKKSLATFSTGLLNGERGAQLSAKALTDFTTPLISAAETISGVLTVLSFIPGPIGLMSRGARIAGAALFGVGAAGVSAALKFNEIGAKQLDTLLKSYNDLSGSGIALSTGLEGTLDLMHTLNMTTADAAQLNEMLSKSSKNLALMGGTAATGAKRFAEVSGSIIKSDIGKTFEMMGITQQEQREATLLYMSIQARTGQLQLKNTEQLVAESSKFVYELDQAAQLTGTTRKEQQEAREAAMAEVRFRAAQRLAERTGDKQYQAELKAALQTSTMLRAMGDVKGATGALQLGASRGAISTPEAQAAELTYRISEILANPNMPQAQMMKTLAKNSGESLDALDALNTVAGGIDALQTDVVAMINLGERQLTVEQAAAAAGFNGPDAITKYLEEQNKKRLAPGGDLRLMIEAGRAQQAAAMTMEAGIKTFNYAADIHSAASKTFADAVDKFGGIVGAKVAGGTPTFNNTALGSGINLGDVASAERKLTASKNELKDLNAKIKEQEEKLKAAKTEGEEEQAKAELSRLKGQVKRAETKVNAAELGSAATKRRSGLAQAHENLKAMQSGAATAPAVPEKPISKVISSSPGQITVETADGDKQQRIGNANWRMNNPGNLRPTDWTMSQPGVVGVADAGSSGQFAVFATKADGLRAKENLLFGGNTPYANLSIRDAMYRYAPETDNNDTEAYIKSIVNAVGLPDQTKLASFSPSQRAAMLSAIDKFEGFNVGKVIQAATGGMFNGPMSGYPAVLHGHEAVIPLTNGAVPVTMPALDQLVNSNKAVDAQVQVLRNEMGTMMRELTAALVDMKDSGQQERVIQLLENMARSQQTTATASQRMAQLAAN